MMRRIVTQVAAVGDAEGDDFGLGIIAGIVQNLRPGL